MNIDSDKLLEWIKANAVFLTDGGRSLDPDDLESAIHSGELAPKRVYARAPEYRHRSFIEPGKEYETLETDTGADFCVIDEVGERIFCRWKGCAHLDGTNWERVEK